MNADSAHACRTPLLTLSEVAAIFGVEPATVTRWATAGKLTPITPKVALTRECYFAESEVRALINGGAAPAPDVHVVWAWAGGVLGITERGERQHD